MFATEPTSLDTGRQMAINAGAIFEGVMMYPRDSYARNQIFQVTWFNAQRHEVGHRLQDLQTVTIFETPRIWGIPLPKLSPIVLGTMANHSLMTQAEK